MARVLVVEDNPANMTLATFLVQSAGHAVISATDAEAGLTLARAEQLERDMEEATRGLATIALAHVVLEH